MNLLKAKELTVMKWNWIVSNNGISDISSMISKIPELGVTKTKCGLCDLFWLQEDACKNCPLLIEKTDATTNCKSAHHPYRKWLDNKNTKTARKMLRYVNAKLKGN